MSNIPDNSASVAAAVSAVTPDAAAPVVAAAPKAPSADEAFARKERQIRRMQQELQAERQALKAKQAQYETDYVPKSRLKEDFLTVLEEQGIDYDQITQQVISRPNDPATRALVARIKAMEEKATKAEQAQQDATTAQYEQAKKQISTEVRLLVEQEAEFETIKSAGMQEAVVELIEQRFNEEGFLMDVSEAARQVENHLIEEAFKLSQLSKVQARLKPKVEETPIAPIIPKKQAPMTTISNRMETSTAKRSTDRERRERALAAFNGTLGKTNLT